MFGISFCPDPGPLSIMSSSLQSICRLCGEDRAIPKDRHPVPKQARRNDILKIFGMCIQIGY